MESDITKWILERLSVELEEFNNLPACPFAKQSLLENKIQIVSVTDSGEFIAEIDAFTRDWPDSLDVLILGCNPKNITPEELSSLTETANNTFLKERDFLALEDHPDYKEMVGDFVVNEGNWALVLLQKRSKVVTARKILDRRGYYKNWDETYYKEVVLDRS
jgi:hypothetical protein